MATRTTKTMNMPEMAQPAPEQFDQRKRPDLGEFGVNRGAQVQGCYALLL